MLTPDIDAPAGIRHLVRGRLAVELAHTAEALRLQLRHDGTTVADIALGITVDGVELGALATVTEVTSTPVREEYVAAFGKAAGTHEVAHDEYTVRLRSGAAAWQLVLRLADDGIAFRYVLPASAAELGPEHTRIAVPLESRAWVLDYETWYETPRFGADISDLPTGPYGFPVLVRAGDTHILLTESDIDGNSSGAHVEFDGSTFAVTTADGTTSVLPGHRTPWRVVIAGSLDDVVRSQLVDELAPRAAQDAVVPRPGRGAWSWWSSQYSGAYLDVQKRFTDFAAEQGWEHVLVDCGWDAAWVPELVSYASARAVQVHLWSSWSDLDGPVALQKLALWRSWGVAGIKVDFMESESQDRYRWYDAIIAETARVGLMVNFHGSVIPRGWARTNPHVVSYEAVRGAEYYVFYGQPLTASHNVILPFTRNVVGSMDYTPVAFSAPGRETSDGHELALSVVFESGITHFADDPDEYRSRPAAAEVLAALPPIWHEVRLLDGDPDTHAVVARRNGERWFVGGISSRPEASEVLIDTRELFDGPVDVWIVGDGNSGLGSTHHDSFSGELTVPVAGRGGFVAVVVPAGNPFSLAGPRGVREVPIVEQQLVALVDGAAELSATGAAVRVPPGWSAEPASDDSWRVAPDSAPTPGDFAVFAFEAETDAEVPVIAHARVVVPLDRGDHVLSRLPFLWTRNAVGPVERNLANGGGDPRDGAELTVQAVTYPDGIGVSQDSEVRFALVGARGKLTGAVAVDDETPNADAIASVLIDGIEVWRLPIGGSAVPVPIEIELDGASVLTLLTEPGSANAEAHVDWLAMRLQVD